LEFINQFGEDVYVFLYDHSDPVHPLLVRDPTFTSLVLLARKEWVVASGATQAGISHPDGLCYVGVKRVGVAGLGRLGPFIAALTPDVYDDSARLELAGTGELHWLNRPALPPPTPALTPAQLNTPLPAAPGLVVGVGKARITDIAAREPNSRLPMQGWADFTQVSGGVDDTRAELMARAFIVADPALDTRTVMVVIDLWSCSIAIKQAVIRRLGGENPEMPYRMENVSIAGTHTHSAPAGFLHHFLYNAMAFGFDGHVFESVVAGIVRAIELAHLDLAPGRVLLNAAPVQGITRNRSLPAFRLNPAAEQAAFPAAVDETMTLLRLEHEKRRGGPAEAIGALNWFAIHPTNRGARNTLVNGDNKGWAAHRMEEEAPRRPAVRKTFVAGFANGACGDASGNFRAGSPGFDPVQSGTPRDLTQHRKRMEAVGETQCRAALILFDNAQQVLAGPVASMHQQVDMEQRTGTPAALGLSMAAGSEEDGGPGKTWEGITMLDPAQPTLTSAGSTVTSVLAAPIALALHQLLAGLSVLLDPTSLTTHLQSVAASMQATTAMIPLHFPKPLMLMVGLMRPVPWVPNILELQCQRIGQFALLSVPAEVSTVAGLRLRRAAMRGLSRGGVESAALGTYANGYASYVTTPEEYASQQYEGASTLFGPQTCTAMESAFGDLGKAVATAQPIADDAPVPDLRGSVLAKPRMTVRNASGADMRFRIFLPGDSRYRALLWAEADFVVADGTERALIVPAFISLAVLQVQIVAGNGRLSSRSVPPQRLFASTDDLVVALPNGALARSTYFPTTRDV
jgi:neutral ceramidase